MNAQELKPLNSYLEENNLDDPAALLYLALRCSALYAHSASVTQNRPEVNSKLENATMELVLFAANVKSQLSGVNKAQALDLNMPQFDMMFTAVKEKAEKNWAMTGSYGDDTYWADMEVCGNYYQAVSN